MNHSPKQRKIIHVDMDCFYAAIEIRDDPSLLNKPVAVGGASDRRGVLCTCNYIAREYGVRSAMSTGYAYRLCPDLVVVPVNMPKYREAAKIIRKIFAEFTDLIEPLSLDEAYLDVTDSPDLKNSATLIAKEIQRRIFAELKITASAGVAPNKFLAKIASGWKKPNGLFVIRPQDIDHFVKTLPVKELFGVGKVTAKKLQNMNLLTCADIQKTNPAELINKLGKLGQQLYNQSHGIDNRAVQPNRIRKSLSVEETFSKDILQWQECEVILPDMFKMLLRRLSGVNLKIKNQFVKIKFSDFKQKTVERSSLDLDINIFRELLHEGYLKEQKPIRLLGIGVRFQLEDVLLDHFIQQDLFSSLF